MLQNTQSFIREYISQSEYIDSTKKLKKNVKNNKYDVFIVGSDQTWRPNYSPNIYDYYLNFLSSKSKAKRIAYASSFGVDTWEYTAEETKICAKLASAFDAISVREQSGINLCKNYLNVDSVCVLDPTLLLDKIDYLDIIDEGYEEDKNGGVFTYFLDKNKEKINIAELVSKELNVHNYSCQSIQSLKTLKNYSLDDYIMPKVQEWLSSFANANFVLTDSFHGMVFSIIFEKPFLVIVNKERGAARFESLLSKIGGLNHLIYDSTEICNKIDEIRNIKPLDKRELFILKEDSVSFLKNSISDNK